MGDLATAHQNARALAAVIAAVTATREWQRLTVWLLSDATNRRLGTEIPVLNCSPEGERPRGPLRLLERLVVGGACCTRTGSPPRS